MTNSVFGKSATVLYGFLIALIIVAPFGLSAVAHAEEINYIGDKQQLRLLRMESYYFSDTLLPTALFPGTEIAPLSSDNKISINYDPFAVGLTNPEMVFGGLSKSENTRGNRVTLLNGQVRGDMYGARSVYGDAVGNAVTVNGGSVIGNIQGGSVAGDIGSGVKFQGCVTDNIVAIGGGSVEGSVFGGWSRRGAAAGNIVIISGGEARSVFGGSSYSGDSSGNTVIISGGSVTRVVLGGCCYTGNGLVAGNEITISGGSVTGNVFGGSSEKGSVTGNTVTISGGSVTGEVYCGHSEDGSATGNTVIISGRPDLAQAHIWGGYTEDMLRDDFTGNTLNLKNSGISVAGVGNFEYYNFDLPQGLVADTVILSVIAKEVFLTQRTVKINLQAGINLKEGDKIALIHSARGVNGSPENTGCSVRHDGALYEFSIYTDKNNLWAEVKTVSDAAK